MSAAYSTSTPSFTTSGLENLAKPKNLHPCQEHGPLASAVGLLGLLSVNSWFCSVARWKDKVSQNGRMTGDVSSPPRSAEKNPTFAQKVEACSAELDPQVLPGCRGH